MTQELSTVDGRSVLRRERRLAHTRDRVWAALTESARLADWFPDRITIELRPRRGGDLHRGCTGRRHRSRPAPAWVAKLLAAVSGGVRPTRHPGSDA